MRKAEMEVAKADNLIKHEAEIFSKPARTWFKPTLNQPRDILASRESSANRLKDKQGERNARKQAKAEEMEQGSRGKKQKLMEVTSCLVAVLQASMQECWSNVVWPAGD